MQDEDQEECFTGTPTLSEIKKYFYEQQKLVNIKNLEIKPDSPIASSEEKLSDSFQLYLKTRQQKLAEAKKKMPYSSPLSSKTRSCNFNETTVIELGNQSWETTTDESFMAQEKICSDVSIPLIDLNDISQSDSTEEKDIIVQSAKKKFNMTGDMTLLGEIEEPSFMQLQNSAYQSSPFKQSPFGRNRPSTIAEEDSISSGKNVSLESFRSAFTRPQSIESTYKTANEDSVGTEESSGSIKVTDLFQNLKPTMKSFYSDYDNVSLNSERSFEPDSLKINATSQLQDMTKDSLDPSIDQSTIEISSSSENSFQKKYEKYPAKKEQQGFDNSSLMNDSFCMENTLDPKGSEGASKKFNDTLEEFEYMMEQGMKMAEENKLTTTPVVPKKNPNTVLRKLPGSPTTKNLNPKMFNKVLGDIQLKSPLASKKPITPSSFKHPQMLTSKIPQPAFKTNKLYPNKPQFSHIVSPIGRYINNTPAVPLQSRCIKMNYDGGISKLYNSRDSDVSFKENYDDSNSVLPVALPRHGKIATLKKQVYDYRSQIKTGAESKEMARLLANSSPTVVCHEGKRNFGHNESQIIDESFADLSLMSGVDISHQNGDISVQVINDAKRC